MTEEVFEIPDLKQHFPEFRRNKQGTRVGGGDNIYIYTVQ